MRKRAIISKAVTSFTRFHLERTALKRACTRISALGKSSLARGKFEVGAERKKQRGNETATRLCFFLKNARDWTPPNFDCSYFDSAPVFEIFFEAALPITAAKLHSKFGRSGCVLHHKHPCHLDSHLARRYESPSFYCNLSNSTFQGKRKKKLK